MTEQSAQVMQEIIALVEQAQLGMQALSRSSNTELHLCLAQTRTALDELRGALVFVLQTASHVEKATSSLKNKIDANTAIKMRLNQSVAQIDLLREELDQTRQQLEAAHPGLMRYCDRLAVTALFSASYTTEHERNVLSAALDGAPVPIMQAKQAADEIELF